MTVPMRMAWMIAGFLGGSAALSGQQSPPSNRVSLDVVVTSKLGAPVAGLQQGDFTVLDNKAIQPVATFKAIDQQPGPTEIVMLVDAVNITYESMAREREQIDKFLRANGGRLAHPTTLAVFTDKGTQIQQGFTKDGNGLAESLDQVSIGLRVVRRDSGFYGAQERLNLSLNALSLLMTKEAPLPGRKIILWISPGWPLLSAPQVQLDIKQEQQILAQVESISNGLRRGNLTVYSINPLGTQEDVEQTYYYENFLKGVSKANQVQLGDLGLQVIAVQSGGLALAGSNDVSSLIERCIAETETYYELSFDAPPGEPNEYHQVEIKISKPGLTAHTRTGYYTQP